MISQNEPVLARGEQTTSYAQISAVSWAAILAGAAAAASLSLILLVLGTGLGFSAVSPWASNGIEAKTFGISTIVWVAVMAVLSSALGGYIAGRLRTKWTETPRDERYFRDTAHGFLAWAVATLVTASLLSSAATSIIGSGSQVAAAVMGGAATTAAAVAGGSQQIKSDVDNGSAGYFIDFLFRRDVSREAGETPITSSNMKGGSVQDVPERNMPETSAEVARIFMNAIRADDFPAADVRYAGQVISQHTGLTQEAAEKRVQETYASMKKTLHDAEIAVKEAADKARKASAYASLWLFISLLLGAFVASWMATCGGRSRDA